MLDAVIREGLEAARDLVERALPKFNWGASALDARAITLLNEAPGKIGRALAALPLPEVREGPTPEEVWDAAPWPVLGSRWLHVKSRRTYQVTGKSIREADLCPLVTYRSSGSGWPVDWTRPLEEFMDGRFSPC